MSCCNNNQNCYHDPCGSSFNQLVTQAAQYAQYAQTQANKAEDLWEEFNALYLGAFTVAPTADNEGNPLQNGALYWNLGSNTMFVWNGSVWVENGNFDEFTNFMLPSVTPVPAANLVTGQEYEIAVVGTTNWTAIGAASATVGVRFTKNAVAATGNGTARVTRDLVTRFADVVNVKDFGAVGDGVTDDTAAIQAAIDIQKGPVFFPNGIYLVSSEIVIKDGTGIIGENPFWKRRTGYVYSGDKNTVIKYVGVGGVNSCVIRASKKAVGVPGSDFSPPDTDDLINIQLQNFHIDANNIAEYGCYIYRAGNCGNVIDKITCEKSKKANHVHLGCYAAKFGVFGAYQGEDHGVVCGWDIFSWNSVEATNFAYSAQFFTANNGTSGTYPADDVSNSGGRFSVGRGSSVKITSEGNNGRSCILSEYNSASFAGGPSDYILDYLEGNGDGPYIDYRDGMDSIRLRCGFFHPGNGSTLLPQNIKIEGKNNSGVVTANSGPSTSSEWLIIDGAVGDLSGTGFDINSNTFKYNVINCTENITYSDKTPAVTRNTDNLVNAGVYFTAANPITVWKAINGTLARVGVGQYVFTFLQPFKTAGAVIPQVSIIVDAGAPFDTKVRVPSISVNSITVNTFNNADVLTDTGDRISVLLSGALE